MTSPEDGLAEQLAAPPDPVEAEVGFHQGKVIAFNLDTGENTIRIKGVDFADLPVMNVTDSAGLVPGMIVGVLRIRSTYFVIGRIANPGSAQFGDITVRSANGGEVSMSAGDVTVKRGSIPNETVGRLFASGADERTWVEVRPPFTQGVSSENRLIVEGSTPQTPNGQMYLITGGQMSLDSGGSMFASGSFVQIGSDSSASILASTHIQLDSTTDDVRISATGASNQPACMISNAGRIYQSSSVRASKVDIEDLDGLAAEDVLKLRPRTWRDRGEVERNPDKAAPRAVGFVAEEIEEIPGMEPFLFRDDNGELISLAYDRFPAALLVVIQDQQRKISDLTKRLEALERKAQK